MLDKNDPRLTAYVLGELDEKEKAIVERAIAQNPELGQCVEDIGATASLLSEEFAAEPLVGLSDQHKVDVMDRTASPTLTVREKDEGTTSTKGFVLKYWAWAAAAACLMAIAVPVLRERYAGSFTAYSAASSAKSESVVDARTAPDGEDAPETNFPMTSEGKDFDRLIELITETVSPEWDEVGGPGAIEEFDGNLSLVIQNTQNVHDDAEPTDGLNDVTQEFVETEVDFTESNEEVAETRPQTRAFPVDGSNSPLKIDNLWTDGLSMPNDSFGNALEEDGAVPRSNGRARSYGTYQQNWRAGAESTENDGFRGPVRVEFVEGTDTTILRGKERDVALVEGVIAELESSESDSQSATAMGGGLYDVLSELGSEDGQQRANLPSELMSPEQQIQQRVESGARMVIQSPEGNLGTFTFEAGTDDALSALPDGIGTSVVRGSTATTESTASGEHVNRPSANQIASNAESLDSPVSLTTPAIIISDTEEERILGPLRGVASTSGEVVQREEGAHVSNRIPSGHQFFAVDIEENSQVFENVKPGDKVRANVFIDDRPQENIRAGERTILRSATVFAANERRTESGENQKQVLILVQPADAEKLLLAKQLGTLTLEAVGNQNSAKTQVTAKPRARKNKPKTWRRVKAIPNTTRLMIGDKEELDLNGMQVHVQVDGFRARVLVDYVYYNDRDRQLEGKFKLRLPDDASLYYFAFGQSAFDLTSNGELPRDEFLPELEDGTRFVSLRADDIKRDRANMWTNVKEARMVPKEKAAFAYGQTVRRRVDPALVEWSGAGVFNASVFPLMPKKLHRIVIGYDVNLTQTDDGLAYELTLPEQIGDCKIELNVQDVPGATAKVKAGSKVKEKNTRKGKRFRINKPEPGDTIRLTVVGSDNVLLRSQDEKEGDFFATRLNLDLPTEANAENSSRAVFLVDTSLSSRPDKFNVWLDLLRATLDNNRDSLDEFGVMFFNVENHFWKEEYVANTPENVRQLVIDCQQLALEGATDLYAATQRLTSADWITASDSPDLFLLSDGAANWGETNLRLIHQVLDRDDVGSLFAYQTGLTGTAVRNLRFLTSETGGAVFSVANEDEVEKASTAHRSRPWELKAIEFDGARDVLTAGRVQWVYPNQPITVVGRLEDNVDPADIKFVLERGSEERTVAVAADAMMESDLASRLYGQVAVGQLESLGQTVFDVSAAYSRHFRITGQTCSLLMLESEADYKRFNIVPEQDLFVIKSKNAGELVESTLDSKAEELADPKAQFLAWLKRLENMPGMEFKMPTALRLVIDDIEYDALFDQLECESREIDDLTKQYLEQLSADRLNYDAVTKEAQRRGETSSADAIKVLSSLIEQNTGDLVLARDVAFSAMEMSRPAQAYHLLRRIAMARPYDASIYTALGQCLTQMNKADMAVVFYEIALGSKFQNRQADFRKIAGTEYAYLLREIASGRRDSKIKGYAEARLESLGEAKIVDEADLLITMQWNTDQSDVDLHVIEPSGEECFYSHPQTRSGGRITRDITDGFGPEMYAIKKAPNGEYDIQVKYFGTNTNRIGMRSKVYLTIYRDFGAGGESVIRKVVNITKPGQKEPVEKLIVK